MIIGGSTGAGAGIGGLIGGKKGALIGAAIGGGAATIYEARQALGELGCSHRSHSSAQKEQAAREANVLRVACVICGVGGTLRYPRMSADRTRSRYPMSTHPSPGRIRRVAHASAARVRKRLLVVDDELPILKLVTRILATDNYEIASADSATAAQMVSPDYPGRSAGHRPDDARHERPRAGDDRARRFPNTRVFSRRDGCSPDELQASRSSRSHSASTACSRPRGC